jgi:hypothetical protein
MVVEALHLRYSYDGGIGSIVTKAVAQCASDFSEHGVSPGPLLASSCFKFPKTGYSLSNIEQVGLTLAPLSVHIMCVSSDCQGMKRELSSD